ncbi:hypothetical protein BDR26DRAFT_869575 [Obelidium mucronatum]|nr:hypothetical protein BDR26DRAFT_869575 [Obelidium mucronatum]
MLDIRLLQHSKDMKFLNVFGTNENTCFLSHPKMPTPVLTSVALALLLLFHIQSSHTFPLSLSSGGYQGATLRRRSVANETINFIQLSNTNYCFSRESTSSAKLIAAICNPSSSTVQQFLLTRNSANTGYYISDRFFTTCVQVNLDGGSLSLGACTGRMDQLFVSGTDSKGVILRAGQNPQVCVKMIGSGFLVVKCPIDDQKQEGFQFLLRTSPIAVSMCPSPLKANTMNGTMFLGNSRLGSVYGNIFYDPAGSEIAGTSFQPQPIRVNFVDSLGIPLSWCRITWISRDGVKSGWTFPTALVTDQEGNASAFWVSGAAMLQYLDIEVLFDDGTKTKAVISGLGYPHQTKATGINLLWTAPSEWEIFSVDLKPHSLPPSTSYTALSLGSISCGLQNDGILFSISQQNVRAYNISSDASCVSPVDGQVRCLLPIPTAANISYTFELSMSAAVSTRQNATLKLINQHDALKTHQIVQASIQDTSETPGISCLDNDQRFATYSNVKYFSPLAGWKPVNQKTAFIKADFSPEHNAICSNYKYEVSGGEYRLSTGGMAVGPDVDAFLHMA